MTENTSEIQWYIARDGKQYGPLSEQELDLFIDGGHLHASDLVWKAGFDDWLPAFDVFPPKPKEDGQIPSPVTEPKSVSDDSVGASSPKKATEKKAAPSTDPKSTDRAHKASDEASDQSKADKPVKTEDLAKKATATTTKADAGKTADASKPSEQADTKTDAKTDASTASGSASTENETSSGTGDAYVDVIAAQLSNSDNKSATSTGAPPDKVSAPAVQTGVGANAASDNADSPAPGAGARRLAIAASVAGILGLGGWFAVQNNQHVAAFVNSASAGLVKNLNLANVLPGTSDNAKQKLSVVKAPETPVRAKPTEQQNKNTQTTTLDTSPTVAVERVKTTPVSPSPGQESPSANNTPTNNAPTTPAAPAPDPQFAVNPDGTIVFNQAPPTNNTTQTAALTQEPPAKPPLPKVDQHYLSSPLWAAVRLQFPTWHDEQVREIAKLSEDKSKTEVAQLAMTSLIKLRKQHGKAALSASPEKLREIADSFLQNLKILKSHSTDACYGFISSGETNPKILALLSNEEQKSALEAQSAAIFQAIEEGRKNPQNRSKPGKTDYDMLAGELGQIGWTQADLQLFADPKALASAAPERVCQMVQDWFTAHIAIKDQTIQDRLLFETLRPLIAS